MSGDTQGAILAAMLLFSLVMGIFLFFKLYHLFQCGGFLCLMAACVMTLGFCGVGQYVNIVFSGSVPPKILMFCYIFLSWTVPSLWTIGMLWCVLRLRRFQTVQFKSAVSEERNY